ncbi:polysaccharide biosynthesis tyrosine autokinase [Chloroflexota bacterium]
MEIKQYLFLVRKWLWLIFLGAIVGGLGAYYWSARQPEIYQTSTRIMVSRPPDEGGVLPYNIYNDLQLAKTYAQLISVAPVLESTGEKVGAPVSSSQISVRQVPESMLLDVTVEDPDPQQASLIANTLVTDFIEYNSELQIGRFIESENSLLKQASSMEDQISDLQTDINALSTQSDAIQRQEQEVEIQQRLDELKLQLDLTEEEIIKLEGEIAAFFPIPEPTSTPQNRWSATATPVPTPTLSPENFIKLKETENRLDQYQTLRDLYNQTYANVLVLGDSQNQDTSQTDTNARLNQLQATLVLYQQIYTNILNNLEAIQLAKIKSTTTVVLIQEAPVPIYPIHPQPLRDTVVGVVGGAMAMAALAFLIEFMDDTLKTPDDVKRALQLPTIGLIGEMTKPKNSKKNDSAGVYVADNPLSPITEAFRQLRTNLEFAGVNKPLNTLLITSTAPSEGKTTMAVNLATVIAQGNKKVVLIDSDLRRPSVHRYLGIANRRGLSDVFRGQVKLSNLFTPWGNPQVAVLTSGGLPPNPSELLGSEKMDKILAELTEMVDIVILDAPPAIVADPIILAAKVDGVLIVIEPGETKTGQAQVMMEQMQRAGARVIGAVLNPISRKNAHYYSKYRYYSSAYYSSGNGYHHSGNGSGKGRKTLRLGRAKKKPELSETSE